MMNSMARGSLDDKDSSSRLRFTTELLEQDARPSFIVNPAECHSLRPEHLPVLYCNPSVLRKVDLRKAIFAEGDEVLRDKRSMEFRSWITRLMGTWSSPSGVDTLLFQDIIWTVVRLQDYLIVSGLPREDALESSHREVKFYDERSHLIDIDQIQTLAQPKTTMDIAPLNDKGRILESDQKSSSQRDLSKIQNPPSARPNLFHDVDWSSTSFGSTDTWSPELHLMCSLVMNDPEPALLFWGDDLVAIHNSAAVSFFPLYQGVFIGSTSEKIFPEMWKSFSQFFDKVRCTRQVVRVEEIHIAFHRHGRMDECFVSLCFFPIENNNGDFLGVYETAREITKEALSRRRLATLLEVSTCSGDITEEKMFWKNLLHALAVNKEDVGFAMLYSLEDSGRLSSLEPDFLTRESRKTCTLEGILGIPEDHISAKPFFDLDQESTCYSLGFKQALELDTPILLQTENGTLPEEYVSDLRCRAYSAPMHSVVICPIRPTRGDRVVGFLIMGLSSRVAYDDDFRQFIDILNRQIATSVASVFLFNEEIRRERKRAEEATLVHAKLRERLEQKTNALLTSETKFERMADKIPIGISITNRTGEITYANEAWYKILGHSGADTSASSWVSLIHEEDVHIAVSHFEELIKTKKDTSFEIRLRKEWIREIEGAGPIRTATWIIASAYTEQDADGEAEFVVGALTDISAQKWAEETHRRRMVEALKLKGQQESFIDTISHEMRNPLSAILQSADEISEYLGQQQHSSCSRIGELRSSIEAVDTIMLCCQHQRRVIDDVLTLSRMNADMLTIAPIESDPLDVVNSVVKMFSGEAKKQGISLLTRVESSLAAMDPTRLIFDPSRFSQILVNLLGNAIKFTCDSPVRQIQIFIGIFSSIPPNGDHGVEYAETQSTVNGNLHPDIMTDSRLVYLRIVVQDTGIGMVDSERQILFQRFTQASPRTHLQYGGSGLGLFISKKLATLQGGAIGLKMGDQEGTTFAFYIRTSHARESKTNAYLSEDGHRALDIAAKSTADSLPTSTLSTDLKLNTSDEVHSFLVVEDNLINQRVVCMQLQKKGHIVYAANHGVEALEFLEKTKYWRGNEESGKPLSLILLDIEMPVMDGLTCIRRIRQLQAEGILTGHIPVISVSANARLEQVEEAKAAGMDENVSKPFRTADLFPKIRSLLARRRIEKGEAK